MQSIKKKEELIQTVKAHLTSVFQVLKAKIGVGSTAQVMQHLINNSKGFKLNRFESVMTVLKGMIDQALSLITISFDGWFASFLNKLSESNVVRIEYLGAGQHGYVHQHQYGYHNGNGGRNPVCCQFYWGNPDELYFYPSQIIEKWHQLYLTVFQSLEYHDLIPCEQLKENCKPQRLALFRQMISVKEVTDAIEAFANRVTREARF